MRLRPQSETHMVAVRKKIAAARDTAATLSIEEARRIALHAQGFGRRSKDTSFDAPMLARIVSELGVVQMDSVNVLVRSHYLPFFSRHGAYDREVLARAAYDGHNRLLFEYWGHEASLMPLATQPLFRWRMERARAGMGAWKRVSRFLREQAKFVSEVKAQLRDRGPLGAGEIGAGNKGKKGWWEWSDAKTALECLFWVGDVTTATRRHFERIYDLTERVLPPSILAIPTPDEADARRTLLDIAARALGIATESDLRDYFRLGLADARTGVAELAEQGRLLPVRVEGWKQPAWRHVDADTLPGPDVSALLSPFDSLVWERSRTERLFDFHFRLEIYTPAHKRVHGYYVLPFLLGDRIVARVDLKSDRSAGVLRVVAAHVEEGADQERTAHALWRELGALSTWLGLERVALGRRGRFMQALRSEAARNSGC
jgi:uncharacterized protein YcaQ